MWKLCLAWEEEIVLSPSEPLFFVFFCEYRGETYMVFKKNVYKASWPSPLKKSFWHFMKE